MKIKILAIIALLSALLPGFFSQANAQTVNFCQNNLGANPYRGPGAYTDPATSSPIWNLFPSGGSTSGYANNSTGNPTLTTFSISSYAYYGWYSGQTRATNAPYYLLGGFAHSSALTFSYNNVPQGVYSVYLIAQGGDGSWRGGAFSLAAANGGSADGGITTAFNGGNTPNSFIEGQNYVRFNGVVPDANGNITVNEATTWWSTDEVDLNGAQLVFVSALQNAWDTSPNSANLNTANWTSGTTPGSGTATPVSVSSLYFGVSSQTSLVNDFGSGFNIAGLTFNSGASTYTMSGSVSNNLTGNITNNSTSLQTINFPMTLTANRTVTLTSGGGNVALGGVISDGGSGYGLTTTGNGKLTLNGLETYAGNTTVGSGTTLTVGSSGELYSASWTPGAVITVNSGGTFQVNGWGYGRPGGPGDIGISAGNIVVNGGTIEYLGDGSGSPSFWEQWFSIGTGGCTLKASGSATWQMWGFNNYENTISIPSGQNLTLAGAGNGYISQLITGSGNIVMNGTGTWTLDSATNTYSGNTAVNSGTLLVNANNSGSSSAYTVASSATLGGSGTIGGNVTFSSGANALFNSGSTLAVSGSLTLNANTVKLNLPSNLGAGTYTLATYNTSGSSGSFSATPAVLSGSFAANTTNYITTAGGQVNLHVLNLYTLTYAAGANGSLSGTTSQTVVSGNSGSAVTATPNTGYHFVNWSDSSTVNPRTDASVSGNISVTANFAINTYAITATQSANGMISPGGSTNVNYGGSQTYTITPDTGYSVDTVTVDGSSVTPATSYTFSNVTATHSITATYAPNNYTLIYNGGANGTINGVATQMVAYLTSGSAVTAVANPGYGFANWSDGVTTATRTDTALIGGTNVTATYTNNTYTLTYAGGAGGSISGSTNQTVAYLTSGSAVTAVASNGYAFTSWSDGLTTSNRTDTALIGGTNVTASFVSTCTSPAIVGGIDPDSATLTAFSPLVLTLTNVTGSADLAYQWRSNSVAILNATNSSYTNLSVVVTDAGNYDCVVTNDCGAVTSSVVVVAINPVTPIVETATTASAITYGQSLSSSIITVGSFTNALGAAVVISSYGFVNSSIAPNAGTTNVAVYYLPTDSTNYVNVTNTVSVVVSPATLSITANNDNKVYGQTKTYGAGSTNFTSSGLQNSETIGSVTITATSSPTNGTAATDNVGSYVLTPSAATGGSFNPANYSISYNPGTLSVIPASTFVGASSSENPSGYKDNITYTATLPTDATGNVVFSSATGAFSTNAASGGSAMSLAINSLLRGTNVITISYLGDPNYLASSTNLSQVVTNHPPEANVMAVTRTAGLALIIKLSDIATNWSDADGDTIELTSVTMQSTNGVNLFPLNWSTNLDGSIVTTNGYAYIGYTNSPNVNDQISYGISDGFGGTNIGYVNIVIQGSVTGTNSITAYNFTSPGSNTVTAYGIPYFSYILERSTNLSSPVWVDVQTNQAAPNGVINMVDLFMDLGGIKPSPAFYQLKWQP